MTGRSTDPKSDVDPAAAASVCTIETGPHCGITSAIADAASRSEVTEQIRGVSHGHTHGPHGHGHTGHAHGAPGGEGGLRWVLALTATFMVAEFVGGIVSNSLALLADAAHMLTDVGAIGLSLFALWFARRPPTPDRTFGYLRMEILAALLNAVTLIVLSGFIFLEAWQRFSDPVQVRSGVMLGVASAGLLANVVAALVLHRSAAENLNVRGAYLHVLGDLLGSVGAILAALVIMVTGWSLADPLISVLVGALIVFSSWKLLRESVDILLESVPAHIDMAEVQRAIDEIPGVDDVHDLHVWTVTSGFLAMSGHAVVTRTEEHNRVLCEVHRRMVQRFGIRHVTFQLEQ